MLEILKKYFGYDEFRPMQGEIISHILEKKDAFVLMPTGGGKSLCYQLPALKFPGITLVVSPLIALMKDQVDALKANGIAAEFINSSLSPAEIEDIRQAAQSGKVKILYLAPERLALFSFQDFLKTIKLSLIAIDEAHCISEWGHDFRPDYRNLIMLRKSFPGVPVVALTATATERVREDIIDQLNLKNARVFISSFDRPNLTYAVLPKKKAFNSLLALLRKHANRPAIIYCFSRRETETLSRDLRRRGFNSRPYHAGLAGKIRKETQEKFTHDEVQIIVATIAFGMGIDKPDIRLIIHHSIPKSIEGYYQETGRAGRDGLPSDCVLFFSLGDAAKHKYFIRGIRDDKERDNAEEKLQQVIDYAELETCRREYLLGYFSEWQRGESCGGCDVCLGPLEGTEENEEEAEPGKETVSAEYGSDLFERLRALRKRLADERGVPPFVVFGDVSLKEMARRLPQTRASFLRINGVGAVKLERYGRIFMETIREHIAANGISPRPSEARRA